MNVLIVDDNKNNRMILKLLLEDYQENEKDISFNITEAEDGLIAIEKVKNTSYDLIFMDIMMPNLDGIAATASIRRLDKKAMIIAVSAVDDNERKKIILNNGAEDYISKPVNGDIFNVRLQSYLKLIQSRQGSFISPKRPHNLFSRDIYPYHMHFDGESEDMLASFWEYYLVNNTPYEGISDIVRFIYDMALTAVEKGEEVNIYEENTDFSMYLTLEVASGFDPDMIMHFADKNSVVDNYKLEDRVLSTSLSKVKVHNFIERSDQDRRKEVRTSLEVNSEKQEPTVEAVTEPKTTIVEDTPQEIVENQVFDFLDPEDFEDLQEYISKLNSLLLIVGSSSIEDYEVDEMVVTLLQLSKTACSYNDLYKIGASLGDLGNAINSYKEAFVEKSSDLGPLAVAFGGDLSQWFRLLFIEGAPSIDFLDDSIVSNAQMIESFINPNATVAAQEDEVDDIFDF